jgi:hypothetical protein
MLSEGRIQEDDIERPPVAAEPTEDVAMNDLDPLGTQSLQIGLQLTNDRGSGFDQNDLARAP